MGVLGVPLRPEATCIRSDPGSTSRYRVSRASWLSTAHERLMERRPSHFRLCAIPRELDLDPPMATADAGTEFGINAANACRLSVIRRGCHGSTPLIAFGHRQTSPPSYLLGIIGTADPERSTDKVVRVQFARRRLKKESTLTRGAATDAPARVQAQLADGGGLSLVMLH